MSEQRIAELKGIAQEALDTADKAESPAQRQEFLSIAEEAIKKMDALKAREDSTVPELVASSPVGQVVQKSSQAVSENAPSLFDDVNTAFAKSASGVVAAPYELASMVTGGVTAGLNMLGGDFENPLPSGAGYNTVVEFAGANRPYTNKAFGAFSENVSEAAIVAAPAFAVSPFAGAAVFGEEMLRQSMGDAARQYITDPSTGNFVANAIEMTPLSPTEMMLFKKQPKSPVEAQRMAEEQAAKQRRLNDANQRNIDEMTAMQAKASEYGITLTRGEATGDRVTMAIENRLQKSPEGGILVDVQQDTANKFMAWMQKGFNISDSISDPSRQLAVMNGLTDGYLKTQKASFDAKRAKLFEGVPDRPIFNSAPILDELARIEQKWGLVGDGVNIDTFTDAQKGIRAGINRIRDVVSEQSTKQVFDPSTQSFKSVPSGDFTARDISAVELQRLLADIGQATFKGDNPSFAGTPRNITQAIGRDLGGSINAILTQAAESNPDLAALKNAREGFKVLMEDAKASSQLPFITMFDKPLDISNPTIIADSLLDMPATKGGQGLAMGLITQYAPDMLPEIRTRALERVFQDASKGSLVGSSGKQIAEGFDVNKLKAGFESLESNKFFADKESRKAFNEYKANLQPILERVAARELTGDLSQSEDNIRKLSRIITEISGVVGGTPARYTAQVGERVTETVTEMMRDPRAMATLAVTPYMPSIVRKAVTGATMSKSELDKLNAYLSSYKISLAQDLGQMASENEEWKQQQEAIQAQQLQTLSAQPPM